MCICWCVNYVEFKIHGAKIKIEILTFMLFTKIITSRVYSKCLSHTCNMLLAYISTANIKSETFIQ